MKSVYLLKERTDSLPQIHFFSCIHFPFSFPGGDHGGNRLRRSIHASLSPAPAGRFTDITKPLRDVIFPAGSGSALRSLSSGTRLIQLYREPDGGHPRQVSKSPQLAPLESEQQRLYSEALPDYQVPHLSLRVNPATLRRCLICPYDFILLVTTHSVLADVRIGTQVINLKIGAVDPVPRHGRKITNPNRAL